MTLENRTARVTRLAATALGLLPVAASSYPPTAKKETTVSQHLRGVDIGSKAK